MKLFSGSANIDLANEVAEQLHLPLAKSTYTRFDDSEIKVTIQENVKKEDCIIIQPTCNPVDTHLMELAFFADALKRSEAGKITAVIPYFGYSRQNQQHLPGECVSLNVVVRLLELVGFTKVITYDFHEEEAADMFSIAFQNASAYPVLAEAIKKEISDLGAENTVVISPDQGGVERARVFSDSIFGKNAGTVGIVEKQRNLQAIHQSRAVTLLSDVKGKKVILVDDIVTSGGTIINAANLCRENGAANIYAVVTHPDFSPDTPAKLTSSPIKRFFTTNSIPLAKENTFDKLTVISIAADIARQITL